MKTPRQIVLRLLNDNGGQTLTAIILECRVNAPEIVGEGPIRWLLSEMIKSGELFTDGTIFATHRDEISPGNLLHCTKFLVDFFERDRKTSPPNTAQ